MALSKEKIEQIFKDAQKLPQNDTLAPIINKMKDIKGDVISLLIYAYKAGGLVWKIDCRKTGKGYFFVIIRIYL